MTEWTYETIANLVDVTKVEGDTMTCVFKCPASGKMVHASSDIRQSNRDSMASRMKGTVQASLARSVRRNVTNLLSKVFGQSGTAGQLARQLSQDAMGSVEKKRFYSEREKHRAVVVAFQKVQGQFFVDEESGDVRHVDSKPGKAAI